MFSRLDTIPERNRRSDIHGDS